MAVALAECVKPGCLLPATATGCCVQHNIGLRQYEPDRLVWGDEATRERQQRRRALRAIDALIGAVEASNLRQRASRPAPGELVLRYRILGGLVIWEGAPSGHQLHCACLVLQEHLMRQPEPMGEAV